MNDPIDQVSDEMLALTADLLEAIEKSKLGIALKSCAILDAYLESLIKLGFDLQEAKKIFKWLPGTYKNLLESKSVLKTTK